MKSYCVKQKQQTECVPGSEKYVKAKNGRLMMKCKCVECGIIKTRFVSNKQSGRGIGETINKKIGDKIPGFQQAKDLASAIMGVTGGDKKLFDEYWSGDIAKGAFNKKKNRIILQEILDSSFKRLYDETCEKKIANGIILMIVN